MSKTLAAAVALPPTERHPLTFNELSDLRGFFLDSLRRLERLDAEVDSILQAAKKSGDHQSALAAIRELSRIQAERRASRDLLARGVGELESGNRDAEKSTLVVVVPTALPSSVRPVPAIDVPGHIAQLPEPETEEELCNGT